MARTSGRIGGHGPWPSRAIQAPLLAILAAAAFGWGAKPTAVVVVPQPEPPPAPASKAPEIHLHLPPPPTVPLITHGRVPKEILDEEIRVRREMAEGRYLRTMETPPIYFSDCEDDPVLGVIKDGQVLPMSD